MISKSIIAMLVIFSTFFGTAPAYSFQATRLGVLISNGLFGKEPVVVRCTVVKKFHGYTVFDVHGNRRVSGYYVVRGTVRAKRGERVYCLTDGHAVEVLK